MVEENPASHDPEPADELSETRPAVENTLVLLRRARLSVL